LCVDGVIKDKIGSLFMLVKKFNVHNHGEAIYQSWDTIIILFYRQRDGYAEGDYTLFHTLNASEFIQSPNFLELLGATSQVCFFIVIRILGLLIPLLTRFQLSWVSIIVGEILYSLIHVLVKKTHHLDVLI
jgi:hypothetical protein